MSSAPETGALAAVNGRYDLQANKMRARIRLEALSSAPQSPRQSWSCSEPGVIVGIDQMPVVELYSGLPS